MSESRLAILRSILLGAAVGDALGVPYEFRTRGSFAVTGMTGGGAHNRPAGTWSDDTALMLGLADSITDGHLDMQRAALNAINWLHDGQWTSDGVVFDVGNATHLAVSHLTAGCPPEEAGGTNERSNGNGSLMRIAPLVILLQELPQGKRFELVRRASSMTHRHAHSVAACTFWCEMLLGALAGKSPADAYADVCAARPVYEAHFGAENLTPYARFLSGVLGELPEDAIGSSGWVVHTLEAATWCMLTTASFEEAVTRAVNLGDDSDTTGCVTGAWAGLWYGEASIPTAWLSTLRGKELIEKTASQACGL